ncbi:hypothetical protein A33Q_2768 [Indibacter alkaliphilus LW1]|uniref:Uncharacterized protein n=1 Tax=Indibacter alkaliphilus (strain CCUG 57479 / KCTC 22604 / LW1) TaxID=1189612 RepID=S2DGF5_INDAL|nr:hypothetical protein [Indibacter alkaliphilus]EOZ96175.1 hypothetical protein A33Q_2768 [Indibacter alkaliphilus LW1]
MTVIDLDSLNGIPSEFLERLQNFDSEFQNNRFLENLFSNSDISNLIEEINNYCLKNQIFGYHYTRAIPNEIQMKGLTCRKGDDIRNSFLTNFGHNFTQEELAEIKKTWFNHFDAQQKKSRDSRLFFNFTTIALKELGAEPLLSNFGGEQIYMPIQELKGIGAKIKSLGKPLILKCKLDPNKIETFYELPWGRIAVSKYHCKINPKANQDGYQFIDVKPENIEIIEYLE